MASLGAGPEGSPGNFVPGRGGRPRGACAAGARPGRGPARTMLGLAGAPGSGKSTIAEALTTALADLGAVVVPFDGFHLANLDAHGAQRSCTERELWTPSTQRGYSALLKRLRDPGPTVYAPSYQRSFEEAIAGVDHRGTRLPSDHHRGELPARRPPGPARGASMLTQARYIDLDDQTRLDRLVGRHVTHGKTADDARELGTRHLIRSTPNSSPAHVTLPTLQPPEVVPEPAGRPGSHAAARVAMTNVDRMRMRPAGAAGLRSAR